MRKLWTRIVGEWLAARWWIGECAEEIRSAFVYWRKQRPFSRCRCCGEVMGSGYAAACEGVCWPCRQNCELDCSQYCGLDVGGDISDDDVPF